MSTLEELTRGRYRDRKVEVVRSDTRAAVTVRVDGATVICSDRELKANFMGTLARVFEELDRHLAKPETTCP